MADLKFEWDEDKNTASIQKHAVSFEEALTVFSDEKGLFLPDTEHSEGEERFVLMGFSSTARLVVVSHVFRKEDLIIRIISARTATRRERESYGKVKR